MSNATFSAQDLAKSIEATRLGAGVTLSDTKQLVEDAIQLGARGVCLPVRRLEFARLIAGEHADTLDFVTVINFPFGDHPDRVITKEIGTAIANGADHIDAVAPIADVLEERWDVVGETLSEITATANTLSGGTVKTKLILESAALDKHQIVQLAVIAIEAGFDWLKTSTGFHSAGGATVETVRLLRDIAPENVGIKASGGIRTTDDALAMLEAGADRIGTSRESAILKGILPGGRGDAPGY